MKFLPNFNTTAPLLKVIPASQETSTSCHSIHTIIFHFTDGEGLSVNFRKFLLYHLLTILSNLSIEVNNVFTLFVGDASQTVLQTTKQTAFIVIVALVVYSRHTKH